MPEFDLAYEAQRTLKRIRPRMVDRICRACEGDPFQSQEKTAVFEKRLNDHWERFFGLLYQLYGGYYDFYYYLEQIALTALECWLSRPQEMQELDLRRENNPEWFLSERMAGGSIYVERFTGDLKSLREKIPYFKELGLTYVHLMPLFASRPGNNDGGYAISDYRAVNPNLGSMDDLRALATDFREAGISLVLDFVFNHTSDDHEWALRAQEGEREYMDYYLMFPDRVLPDQYERTLPEVFPTIRRGNFTWHQGLQRWVWTTFNSFQWDLNYANPEVFRAMASEILYLANTGVEILRLDAVAFIWKRMGTNCQNLPEAHVIIQAFNAVCAIAAPGLVFKSEAIVHPDEVVRYISPAECRLSYNPTLMAMLWESLATGQTRLLRHALNHRHNLPNGTVWVNYLRCHDDIGWAFDNGDAEAVGIDPGPHRDYLNRFYTGRVPGSFARGVPFQHNEDTGDMRVSGTMASLAGLEQAIEDGNPDLIETALRRIRMLYGVLCAIGGIPFVFLGEEWGCLNDYSYEDDPDHMDDSRWVHRPRMDWSSLDALRQPGTPSRKINDTLRELLRTRADTPALRGAAMRLLPADSPSLLCCLRESHGSRLVLIANFSPEEQSLDLEPFRPMGLAHYLRDHFTEEIYPTNQQIALPSYEMLWLEED